MNTRRIDSTSPENVRDETGYEVVHVPAGPLRALAGDELVARWTRRWARWTTSCRRA
ncbi:hypothetical protein [Lentzea sp. NPDC059081]|uniref:hypothetical protein n=1 Tax=Lentzea sp. NPDC059081 TaxID=3346719 RepID=UPI003682C686